MTSILLLLAQRRLALALNFWLEKLSWFNLVGDMYSLGTPSAVVNDREAVAEHGRGRSNSPASRLLSEEDQSDVEPVTNAPQSLSCSPSKNLNKEKETMGDKRNALLVVAVLIASTTYQAVLQPPNFTTKGHCVHCLHERQRIWTLIVNSDDHLPHQRSRCQAATVTFRDRNGSNLLLLHVLPAVHVTGQSV
ncbi:hypothetical protein BT93_E1264 [Corymbia citriodora subsp. variegata]|nr:hypothetical protein BT93_E1264 [Corymbia citriodora subsp. variegata]